MHYIGFYTLEGKGENTKEAEKGGSTTTHVPVATWRRKQYRLIRGGQIIGYGVFRLSLCPCNRRFMPAWTTIYASVGWTPDLQLGQVERGA